MYHNHYISTTRKNYHHLPSSIEEHSVAREGACVGGYQDFAELVGL